MIELRANPLPPTSILPDERLRLAKLRGKPLLFPSVHACTNFGGLATIEKKWRWTPCAGCPPPQTFWEITLLWSFRGPVQLLDALASFLDAVLPLLGRRQSRIGIFTRVEDHQPALSREDQGVHGGLFLDKRSLDLLAPVKIDQHRHWQLRRCFFPRRGGRHQIGSDPWNLREFALGILDRMRRHHEAVAFLVPDGNLHERL